jgi:hypothetical protein
MGTGHFGNVLATGYVGKSFQMGAVVCGELAEFAGIEFAGTGYCKLS